MIRFALAIILMCLPNVTIAQSFSCNWGQPACLDYGETVCTSRGKCVDDNAICFDQWQCDYEGFTCRSNVTDCVEDYEALRRDYNDLVDDYNDILETARGLADDLEEFESCLIYARTLEAAQACRY